MVEIIATSWPVCEEDSGAPRRRPLFTHPAGYFMVELDEHTPIGPRYWHSYGVAHEWLECEAMGSPYQISYDLPGDQGWKLLVTHDDEPWSEERVVGQCHVTRDGEIVLFDSNKDCVAGVYADAVMRKLAESTDVATFSGDQPMVLAGPFGLTSFHVPLEGTVFRVLEKSPIEFDDGSTRARRAMVVRDDMPSYWEGLLVWGAAGQPPKLWPDGSHPLLDEPVTSHPLLAALEDILVPTL
ncbi:hypothetical protein BSZ39_07525 [Bowdeniella nasicola]|uniref:Uncharacterized protein n=2 Tax=Bowdeniella nasicola TaxID=208480 RepID=A0A1Q5Q1S8_9ACTO|nr:hypothetical protein BSZ39_07525 [Bowdeniella nasicola]